MGVYGTYGAFSGLGKPSIKLEFEDNESLVAFSKKMQDEEPAPVQWNEEEEMFVPVEGVAITEKEFYDLINANPEKYENYLIEYNDQNLDRLFPNHIDFGKKRYYKIHCNSPYFYDNTVYLPKAALKEHFFNHGRWVFGFILPTLQRPNIVFETDGEVNFVKTFERKNGTKTYVILTPVKKTETRVATTFNKERIENLYNKFKKGGSVLTYPFKEYLPVTTVNGVDTATRSFEIIDIHLPYITKNGAKSCVSAEKSLDGYGDFYTVRDMRKRSRKEPGDVAANKNLQFTKDASQTIKNFNKDLYLSPEIGTDYRKQLKGVTYIHCYISPTGRWEGDTRVVSYYTTIYYYKPLVKNGKDTFKGYDAADRIDVELSDFINVSSRSNGGFEGYVPQSTYKKWFNQALKNQIETFKYAITNKRSNANDAKKELKYFIEYYSNIDKYNAYLIHQYGDPTPLQSQFIADMKEYTDLSIFDGVKSDLGKTANNTLYNNLEILDFRGMQPTYRQLSNYDAFFKPATNKNSLKGFGLADTKKLIADICRNHYKECAAIAKHLKAETKLQSAFNLWHWLHHNIRYEYDREGREEVRTPARTWADRHRGVDCDCLSVFAWCVLKCMGYNPAFELAAFRNKPAYSHIYINLDGIVVDRVWYVFNSRPPFITKTELFKVGMLDNLGQLF